MQRILWLASWYPSDVAPFDGDFIQRHARAAALVQPVHVVHMVKEEKAKASLTLRIKETRHGNLRETVLYYTPVKTGWKKLDKLISLLTYNRLFRRFLQKDFAVHGKPALVHVHVVMRAGMLARWLRQKYGLKYIVTEQWTGYYRYADDNFFQREAWFRIYTKAILKRSSLLLPVSKDLGETITKEIYPLPYTVVPNVADTSLFFYTGRIPPRFRFIHVSSMSSQKNIPGLLRSLQRHKQLQTGWECLLIGPASEELKAYGDELGLREELRWAGECPYAEVAMELQQASAFVLFSWYETFCCVLIEAACCGLPVIAPRTGPLPEIVHPENGLLIEPGNEESLAHAMQDMMRNYNRFDRKKISETASGLFNYERIGKDIKRIYETML